MTIRAAQTRGIPPRSTCAVWQTVIVDGLHGLSQHITDRMGGVAVARGRAAKRTGREAESGNVIGLGAVGAPAPFLALAAAPKLARNCDLCTSGRIRSSVRFHVREAPEFDSI